MKGILYTLKTGNPNWAKITFPTIEAYAKRHDIPLRIWGDAEVKGLKYPHKFCVREWLKEFLATDAEWFCYVDADVYIQKDAPNIFDQDWAPGIYARKDVSPTYVRNFPSWYEHRFGPLEDKGYLYRNAGVYLLDRASAEDLLQVIHPPFIERLQEQHQLNAWFALCHERMGILPSRWNAHASKMNEPGWFLHFMGRNKMPKIQRVLPVVESLIPDRPQWKPNLAIAKPREGAKRVIAIPLKRGGNRWKDKGLEEKELLFVLRSIEKFWKEPDVEVILLSSSRPDWASDKLKFHRAVSYQDAVKSIPTLADEVVWFNDDTYLIAPTGWEDLFPIRQQGIITPRQMVELQTDDNGWRRRLGKVAQQLEEMGHHPVFKFSTHTPYPFTADRMAETLEHFEMEYKTAIETAYFNMHRYAHQVCTDKVTRYKNAPLEWDLSDKRFLNFNDAGLGDFLKGWIRGTFPTPSKFEDPSVTV